MTHLGGASMMLGDDAGFGKRESIADFTRVLSEMVDVGRGVLGHRLPEDDQGDGEQDHERQPDDESRTRAHGRLSTRRGPRLSLRRLPTSPRGCLRTARFVQAEEWILKQVQDDERRGCGVEMEPMG